MLSSQSMAGDILPNGNRKSQPYLENHPRYRKWLVTPIYKPFRPFIRGITPFRGLTNHGY